MVSKVYVLSHVCAHLGPQVITEMSSAHQEGVYLWQPSLKPSVSVICVTTDNQLPFGFPPTEGRTS